MRFGLVDARGECDAVFRLRHGRARIGQHVDQQFSAQLRQLGKQIAAGLGVDGRLYRGQHRAGIQPFLHLHDGHAGDGIAGQYRALDRRRPAPAWQQRTVDVEAAQARCVEHGARQDQAIGSDHGNIAALRDFEELRHRRRISEAARGEDRNTQRLGAGLNRAHQQLLAAPGRLGRAGIDGDDLVPGRRQRIKRRNGKKRRAHVDDPHGHACKRLNGDGGRGLSGSSPW